MPFSALTSDVTSASVEPDHLLNGSGSPRHGAGCSATADTLPDRKLISREATRGYMGSEAA